MSEGKNYCVDISNYNSTDFVNCSVYFLFCLENFVIFFYFQILFLYQVLCLHFKFIGGSKILRIMPCTKLAPVIY